MTKIGIPAWEDDGFFGVSSSYMDYASQFGTPVILSPDSDWEKTYRVDGILLTGGADVSPARYGVPGFFTGRSNPHLEYFDIAVLPIMAFKWEIPVFGICRGLQSLNVLFGGTLRQHLFFHPYSSHDTDLCHSVSYRGGKKFDVNSFHHQAIDKLGSGLDSAAVSDDGLIEAITHQTLKIFAVQWHPERMHDTFSEVAARNLFV